MAAGLAFNRDLHPSPIDADPGRTHQVIANVLANALKFTPAGGRVQMSLVDDGAYVRLEISDTGPGIDPDDQVRLFDRLWRSVGSDGTKGTGIGLSVAAEFIRAQHGRSRSTASSDADPASPSCSRRPSPTTRPGFRDLRARWRTPRGELGATRSASNMQ